MLSNEDIQRLTVSKEDKIDALLEAINKLDEADYIINEAVYAYMPFSADSQWQDEADHFFWNSEGMHEINEVVCAIVKARDLALHAVHVLEGTSEAKAAS